ncbi:unnamed protein product [Adineta steineri]|uniref:Uncharacterized protein n=1 Tax=Adineta steineri TaxID=433720 RepID=A0A815HXH0_9BILA|nr:unnamed protein product [Adineta steineri]CAF3709780.1 unnamed protein product [Adineta steineri]
MIQCDTLTKNILNVTEFLVLIRFLSQTNGNNDDDKRSRSPSQSSPTSVKRLALSFDPPITSSPAILHDRTNQMTNNNMNQSIPKGIKRKLTTHQYTTLDFENDPDNYF